MYSVGEVVSYSTQGVCKIVELCTRTVDRQKREYYVLEPVHDEKSRIYVPIDSEKLLTGMRPVLSKCEIDEIIESVSENRAEWITDDFERKEFCMAVVKSGDRMKLMQLIDMLYLHQEDLKSQKKHFHVADERYLKEAERLVNDEFAYVLEIPVETVPDYIVSRIKG